MIDIEELEKILELAEKAVPGPWRYYGGDIDGPPTEATKFRVSTTVLEQSCEGSAHEDSIKYMASVSPDRITEIVKELIEFRKRMEHAPVCMGLNYNSGRARQWEQGVGIVTENPNDKP